MFIRSQLSFFPLPLLHLQYCCFLVLSIFALPDFHLRPVVSASFPYLHDSPNVLLHSHSGSYVTRVNISF